MRLAREIVAGIVFCLGLVACQAGSLPELGASPTMSPETTDGASESPMETDSARMVALATEKLAGRLAISADEITLVSVEKVQWRDASLGCPKPGVDYIQVLTPGYLIKLEAAGSVYEYHTDDAQRVVTCRSGKR